MSAPTPPPRVVPDSAERRSGMDRRLQWSPSPVVAAAREVGPRVKAGPILTGLIVAMATWILLELALVATGIGQLETPITTDTDSSGWWWSGAMGCIALFLGGLTAGATVRRGEMDDGILHGIATWCAVVIGAVLLTGLGLGLGFGVLGDTVATLSDESITDVTDAVQSAAAGSVLLLGATFLAAVIGAMVGYWLWNRRDDEYDEDSYVR